METVFNYQAVIVRVVYMLLYYIVNSTWNILAATRWY